MSLLLTRQQNAIFSQQFLYFTVHYSDHPCSVSSLHSVCKNGTKSVNNDGSGESVQTCRLIMAFAASINGKLLTNNGSLG